LVAAENVGAKEGKPQGDDPQIEIGEKQEECPQHSRPLPCAALQDDIDGKLLETV
jgi:hypothetical protein